MHSEPGDPNSWPKTKYGIQVTETIHVFVGIIEYLKIDSNVHIHRLISLGGTLNLENHIKSVIGSIMH